MITTLSFFILYKTRLWRSANEIGKQSSVVTGASSGMGKGIVECFVKEGAKVVAVARRKERLEALKESLKDTSGVVLPFVGDVSKKKTARE